MNSESVRPRSSLGSVEAGRPPSNASIPAGTPNLDRKETSALHISHFLHASPGDNDDDKTLEMDEIPWERVVDGNMESIEDDCEYHGPLSLQRRVKQLCREKHKQVFSTDLRSEPADLPPMEIEVDHAKWEKLKTNRLPARV